MRAMIFAAGLGTRLKPYTDHHPKALVDVGGMPMIQRVILKLKNYGIRQMVVNVHHFADQIVDFLHDNDNFGCDIAISDESALLLDTGGGLLAARQWLDAGEPVLVHNADILTDLPMQQLDKVNAHHPDAIATLAVGRRHTSRYLLFADADSLAYDATLTTLRMRGWTNVATGEVRPASLDAAGLKRLAFAGVHIVNPAIFPLLQAYADSLAPSAPATLNGVPPFSIMPFYIQQCQSRTVMGYEYPVQARWHDVGKPEALEAARRAFE